MLERKQAYAQSQKVAQLFYFQSRRAFDAKQSSISRGGGGDTEPGEVFAHRLAPALPGQCEVPPFPPGGQTSFPKGINTWVPPCMCSPDAAGPQFGPGRWKKLLCPAGLMQLERFNKKLKF